MSSNYGTGPARNRPERVRILLSRKHPGTLRMLALWYKIVKRAQWRSLSDDPVYGNLLAAELPKPIENEKESERMAQRLEELDFPSRELTPEEVALREILAALVAVYGRSIVSYPNNRPARWSGI
jgi:hypothetical protein